MQCQSSLVVASRSFLKIFTAAASRAQKKTNLEAPVASWNAELARSKKAKAAAVLEMAKLAGDLLKLNVVDNA